MGIYSHVHKGSVNVSTQENRYKLLSRWYRTPDKIHKFHPSLPPKCWRCNAELGTLYHIWWDCALIKPFWAEIHDQITQITTYTPDLTPAQFLLHHTSIPLSSYKKSLVLHLINAATQCIPIHWRSTSPPSITEWHMRVDRTAEMENLIHQARDNLTQFRETWACWTHYWESTQDTNPKPNSPSTN